MKTDPLLLTADKLSERLGLPELRIQRLARKGVIPRVCVGRRVYFRLDDVVDALLQTNLPRERVIETMQRAGNAVWNA
jgi:excisionase family DNA binding protein